MTTVKVVLLFQYSYKKIFFRKIKSISVCSFFGNAHTNFGFDKSADLLNKRQNLEEDFFQIMYAFQKVRTLNYAKVKPIYH